MKSLGQNDVSLLEVYANIHAHINTILILRLDTSRVPAVLLRGNSTNANISYQSFLPESFP
jgi:hypothetical protein